VVITNIRNDWSLSKYKYVLMLVMLSVLSGCEQAELNQLSYANKTQYKAGDTIQDSLPKGKRAPELVSVPAGTNTLGDTTGEGIEIEQLTYKVTIDKPFAIGKYEVTFDEYDYFCEQTGCKKSDDEGWGRGRRPVIGVTWYDADAYVKWLSIQTGENYYLPSEAQWEYAARAGTKSSYWWGDEPGDKLAQCGDCAAIHRCKDCNDVPLIDEGTVAVGSFKANPYGLYDVHGNVGEWTADCGSEKNSIQPSDGTPRLDGDCTKHIIKDGSWSNNVRFIRSSVRISPPDGNEYEGKQVGFRVARELE